VRLGRGQQVCSKAAVIAMGVNFPGRGVGIGISPSDASITRLVGSVLLEQDEHWQLKGRRICSADSMTAILSLKD
jgi:hypothetical protein